MTVAARLFRIAVALSAICVSSIVYTANPADAATVQVPVHEYNMCSNASQCSSFSDPADLVRFLVAISDPKPWSVFLNEVCSPEYIEVRDYLRSIGYKETRTITVGVGGSCGQYGNAMFTLGNRILNSYQEWTLSGSGETRKLGCEKFSGFAGTNMWCVSHAASATQRSEIVYIMNVVYSGGKFFGGDLNASPGNLPSAWYGSYREVDPQSRKTFDSATPHIKIDYGFSSRATSSSAPSPDCSSISNYSDHCYLKGTFTVPI